MQVVPVGLSAPHYQRVSSAASIIAGSSSKSDVLNEWTGSQPIWATLSAEASMLPPRSDQPSVNQRKLQSTSRSDEDERDATYNVPAVRRSPAALACSPVP